MNHYCPVCGSNQSYLFLERNNVPIFQNMVIPHQNLAAQFREGRITLYACQNCSFIYNHEFEPNKIIYNKMYDNCQFHSKYFSNYVNGLLYRLLEEYKIRNAHIIEIGCGQGEFISKLVDNPGYGNRGIGFDPSYRGKETLFDGRLKFYKDYYSEEFANIEADVIICRHVIEHISKPIDLLNTIRKAVGNKTKTLLFFETPCVNWILGENVFWDIFYEHCSYFNKKSIETAFSSTGFIIHDIKHIFEGQYLWIEAVLNSSDVTNFKKPQFSWTEFKGSIDNFVMNEKQMVANWRNYVFSLSEKKNKVAIWGAGAKGVTFANLVDLNRSLIDCVIDINPNKQGNYLPGTGHLITDVATAKKRGVTHAIIMNPNYIKEIEEMLTNNNISLNLIQDIVAEVV